MHSAMAERNASFLEETPFFDGNCWYGMSTSPRRALIKTIDLDSTGLVKIRSIPRAMVGQVLAASLSVADKEKVLCRNAEKFFGGLPD